MTPLAASLWLLGVAVVLYYVHYYTKPRECPHRLGVPLLGTLPRSVLVRHRRLDWAVEGVKEMGNVFKFIIPMTGTITVVAHPEDVEYVLKTNMPNFVKGHFFNRLFKELLGDGIFNSDGETWRVQRKTASHMFSVNSMKCYMTKVMVEHANTLAAKLEALADANKPVDIQDCFYRFTLDSIGEIAFGVNVNSQTKERVPFAEAFDYCQSSASNRVYYPGWHHFVRLLRWLRIPLFQGFFNHLAVLDAFAKQVIEARRHDEHLSERMDLLSRFMIVAGDDRGKFSDQYLRNTIMNYTIAGRDTTAQALSWSVHKLLTHPRVLQKMLKEIDTVLKDHPLDYTTAVQRLPYTKAVVQETLRLQPSVPVDFKVILKDDVLPHLKVPIKKGGLVMYVPYVMGRMESLWGPDATEFRPERWEEMREAKTLPNAFTYPVFNAGLRTCLGQKMALLEAVICLATLFKRLKFTQLSKNVTYALSVTLPIKNGLRVQPRRRA